MQGRVSSPIYEGGIRRVGEPWRAWRAGCCYKGGSMDASILILALWMSAAPATPPAHEGGILLAQGVNPGEGAQNANPDEPDRQPQGSHPGLGESRPDGLSSGRPPAFADTLVVTAAR